jgi:CAAX amino terminal protease family.
MATTFKIKPISLVKSFLIFFAAGILFYVTIKIFVPAISAATGQTEYIVWMFTGSFVLFLPLFITTFILLKKDGCRMQPRDIARALNLKPLHKKDMVYIGIGLVVASVLCGLIIAVMMVCFKSMTLDSLASVSPIKVTPLSGNQLWLVLFLPVFFFFNYVGEETLWRGYILPRQMIARYGKFAVIINAVLHGVFHFVFGWKPLVMMFPIMLLMPYVVSKTKNTWTSIIIHFLIGAPSQVLIILGLLTQ